MILSVGADRRRVAYAIVESPFGLEFHAASMSVVANGEQVNFIWTTDLKPDAAAEQIAGLIDSEEGNIKAFFASGS